MRNGRARARQNGDFLIVQMDAMGERRALIKEIKMIDKKLAAGDVDRIFIRANQDRSEVLFLPLPCS